MHGHLFYVSNFFNTNDMLVHVMPFSFPRLYLASGVTTIRTTGTFEPYADLDIKKAVDAKERLIVALDLPTLDEARSMVESLDSLVYTFKIGLTLQHQEDRRRSGVERAARAREVSLRREHRGAQLN